MVRWPWFVLSALSLGALGAVGAGDGWSAALGPASHVAGLCPGHPAQGYDEARVRDAQGTRERYGLRGDRAHVRRVLARHGGALTLTERRELALRERLVRAVGPIRRYGRGEGAAPTGACTSLGREAAW
jgi:hypothetical protein